MSRLLTDTLSFKLKLGSRQLVTW